MTGAQAPRQIEGWQLEANSAEAYERYLVPAMMARWADHLVERAAPAPGERVLDVGCGTGIVARRAAARVGAGGRVVGLDLNEGMLAVARAAAQPREPRIEWRVANATALPYPDGLFDVVLSQQMLQFASDPGVALREMRRALAPRGRAALNLCRPIETSPGYLAMARALGRHAGAPAEAMMRSPFPSWSLEDLRGLVGGAGFSDVRVRVEVWGVRYPSVGELLRREAASSPLAGPIGALSPESRDELIEELDAALANRRDDDGIVIPIETYSALARR